MRHPAGDGGHRGAIIAIAILSAAVTACASAAPGASETVSSSGLPTAAATATTQATPGASSEPALELLWEADPPAESEVWAPAIDPTGNVWVPAPNLNQYWIFAADGSYLETWGTPGDGDGELDLNRAGSGGPFGAIVFRPDGGFYVADAGNHRVQQFGPDRAYVAQWGGFGSGEGQFNTPIAISLDEAGNVYVHDDDRRDLQAFTADGDYLQTYCKGALSPISAADGAGNVYCLDQQRVTRVGRDGQAQLEVDLSDLITFATGVAVDTAGHIFVSSVASTSDFTPPEKLVEIDADGTVLHVWPTGGDGLALAPAGDRIYIAHWAWHTVRAYALPED